MTKRQRESDNRVVHRGDILTHPEIGDDKAYTFVKKERRNGRTWVTLVRVRDRHEFTIRCDDFCRGKRPKHAFLYQYDAVKSGEFRVVNEKDLQLGQGSNDYVEFVRTRDEHPFKMRCGDFCAGKRPKPAFLYQYDAVKSGEFKVVNEKDLQLGQGSGKDVQFVRTRDDHPFKMRCDEFCAGVRPPKFLLYQYDAVKSGEFKVVNEKDLQLGQGSNDYVEFVRTRDDHPFKMRCDAFCAGQRPKPAFLYQYDAVKSGEFRVVNEKDLQLGQGSNEYVQFVRTRDDQPFTMRCDEFCRRLCFHCLEFSHCTYASNVCASCWCVRNPASALAVASNEGNKTEILVAALMRAHFGDVRKEHPTRDDKREDVVLLSNMLAVAVDGAHHFFDTPYQHGRITFCVDVQKTDTDKVEWWFADHPGSTYVRFEQRDCWTGYPVNMNKPINFDFIKLLKYVIDDPEKFNNTVVFLEMPHRRHYDEHRRLLDAAGIKHVTLDPRNPDFGGLLEDKRHIFIET